MMIFSDSLQSEHMTNTKAGGIKMGVLTTNGYDPGVSEEKLDEIRRFGAAR
jgi:hypothetical protein